MQHMTIKQLAEALHQLTETPTITGWLVFTMVLNEALGRPATPAERLKFKRYFGGHK